MGVCTCVQSVTRSPLTNIAMSRKWKVLSHIKLRLKYSS